MVRLTCVNLPTERVLYGSGFVRDLPGTPEERSALLCHPEMILLSGFVTPPKESTARIPAPLRMQGDGDDQNKHYG